MGVTVKMVTGDALAIAKETAAKVGMGADIGERVFHSGRDQVQTGYAIVWALVNDRVKLLAYKVLDPSDRNCSDVPP